MIEALFYFLFVLGIVMFFVIKEQRKSKIYDKNGIYTKNYLKGTDLKITADEIATAQNAINMNIYSSDSIEKLLAIFEDVSCDLPSICTMGILFFLTKKDSIEKEKEDEYISRSYDWKYDLIKKKIYSHSNLSLIDFLNSYRDYRIIEALGRDKNFILISINCCRTELDSLYDFINTYTENFNYKQDILHHTEESWLFSGYIEYLDKLYKETIANRNNINCTHFKEFENYFSKFDDNIMDNYSSLLGILVKGIINKLENISIEEIKAIIHFCYCEGNEEKFASLYESVKRSKYSLKDFITCYQEYVFSYYKNQWSKSSIRKLKTRFEVLYHILNIHCNISSSRYNMQRQILKEIDTTYELHNYMELCDDIYENYLKVVDINYILNNHSPMHSSSININFLINDFMKIGFNPLNFNPSLTTFFINKCEQYNSELLNSKKIPNDLIKLTQSELLEIQKSYDNIRTFLHHKLR